MRAGARVVIDTNALISRLLVPDSTPARAVRKAVNEAVVFVSEDTVAELADVVGRSKFDRYLTVRERQEFIRIISRVAELIPIVRPVQACRDPRDDKFLELAVNGDADLIITGDGDLLELDPFHGIRIMRPAAYVSAES